MLKDKIEESDDSLSEEELVKQSQLQKSHFRLQKRDEEDLDFEDEVEYE